jgi:hypothetical protein
MDEQNTNDAENEPDFHQGSLSNQRHELFCRNVAAGTSLSNAYKLAGYRETGASQNAQRLLGRKDIAHRIKELREQANQQASLTARRTTEFYMAQLDSVILHSKNDNARVRAIELAGSEAFGMFIKRSERTDVKFDFARMTSAQLAQMGQAVQARIDELESRQRPPLVIDAKAEHS